jgi:hypothetical protein
MQSKSYSMIMAQYRWLVNAYDLFGHIVEDISLVVFEKDKTYIFLLKMVLLCNLNIDYRLLLQLVGKH